MTEALQQLQQLYQAYIEEARAVETNTAFGKGLFGMGPKAADDPCHMRFIRTMQEQLAALGNDEGMDSAALRELLAWLFHTPLEHEKVLSIYWTLIAAQSAAKPLIPRLSPQDAAALCESYKRENKRWSLLPVQKDVLTLLEQARKGKG